MAASKHEVKPSVVQARQGDTLIIEVENVSFQEQNLLIKDPQGRTIDCHKVGARERIKVRVNLEEAGAYEFLRDKPFYPCAVMKDRIEVQ